MSSAMTDHFVDRCLDGRASPLEIDDYVQRWHESTSSEKIYEFLGMSEDEYSLWLRDPEMLNVIITARSRRLPLARATRPK